MHASSNPTAAELVCYSGVTLAQVERHAFQLSFRAMEHSPGTDNYDK